MNNITNEAFEAALADENNRRVISEVCRKYRGKIPKEELTYRGYIALFHCLRTHNPSLKTKFTSSLHRHTLWQCRKALKESNKNQSQDTQFKEPYVTTPFESLYVRDCMDMLPINHARILKNYYFESKTLQEIGDTYGYSRTAAMQKLRQAEEAFQRLYGND